MPLSQRRRANSSKSACGPYERDRIRHHRAPSRGPRLLANELSTLPLRETRVHKASPLLKVCERAFSEPQKASRSGPPSQRKGLRCF